MITITSQLRHNHLNSLFKCEEFCQACYYIKLSGPSKTVVAVPELLCQRYSKDRAVVKDRPVSPGEASWGVSSSTVRYIDSTLSLQAYWVLNWWAIIVRLERWVAASQNVISRKCLIYPTHSVSTPPHIHAETYLILPNIISDLISSNFFPNTLHLTPPHSITPNKLNLTVTNSISP